MMWRVQSSIAGVFLTALLVGALLASCGGAGNPDQPNGEPEPGATDLTVGASGAAWAAYRDGDGAWQALEGEARYVLALEHPAGRYSVAHVCAAELDAGEEIEAAREVTVSLLYATLAARSEVATPCADETESDFYTLSGAVNGLEADETGFVYGQFLADAVTADAREYSLVGFTVGEYDLLVTVPTATPNTPGASESVLAPPSEVLVRRGIAVQGDETLNLDLGQAVPTTLKNVRVEGAPPDGEVSSSLSLTTLRGTSAQLGGFATSGSETVSFDYAALSTLPEGTAYRLSVESFSEDERGERLSTSLQRTLTAPENLTLSVPDTLGAVALSSDEGRPTLTWSAYREGADYRIVFEDSSDDAGETRYLVALDAAWLPSNTSELSYTVPDFRELPGWNDAWTLGADLFWTLDARTESEREEVVVSRSSAVSAATSEPSTTGP